MGNKEDFLGKKEHVRGRWDRASEVGLTPLMVISDELGAINGFCASKKKQS